MTVHLIDDISDLDRWLVPWSELLQNVSTENVFYDSIFLIPAIKHLASSGEVAIWILEDEGNLIALMPIKVEDGPKWMPGKILTNWLHLHCYLGNPLVRQGFEVEFLRRFYQWFGQRENRFSHARVFCWQWIQINSDLGQALGQGPESFPESYLIRKQKRPFYERGRDGAIALKENMSSKYRKEFNRKWNRLQDIGEVRFKSQSHVSDPDEWKQNFLTLEGSGWKGRQGSSIRSSEKETLFFDEIFRAGIEQNRVLTSCLYLNEKLIAGAFDLRSQQGSFCFKICYDEEHSKMSPGALLQLRFAEEVQQNEELDFVDSCSGSENTPLGRIWAGRIEIGNYISAGSGFYRDLMLKVGSRLVRRLKKLK